MNAFEPAPTGDLEEQDDVPRDVEESLVALMDRYERPLYAYLMAILHDADAALDCAQDTFLRAYEHLSRGKTINARWLYTVARNRATDEFRRRRHLHREPEVLEQAAIAHHSIEGSLDVQRIMDQLSPADREVLYLFEIAGFKTDEIGAMLGMRGSAVRQRLSRARERFRTLYGSP